MPNFDRPRSCSLFLQRLKQLIKWNLSKEFVYLPIHSREVWNKNRDSYCIISSGGNCAGDFMIMDLHDHYDLRNRPPQSNLIIVSKSAYLTATNATIMQRHRRHSVSHVGFRVDAKRLLSRLLTVSESPETCQTPRSPLASCHCYQLINLCVEVRSQRLEIQSSVKIILK